VSSLTRAGDRVLLHDPNQGLVFLASLEKTIDELSPMFDFEIL
jgi:hypothetical protein